MTVLFLQFIIFHFLLMFSSLFLVFSVFVLFFSVAVEKNVSPPDAVYRGRLSGCVRIGRA